jgi:3-oxoacyl-[acyl-carrier-protein] synthase III
VERRLDDDRVLIDATGKAMYVLNQTAWAIWELCDGQRSAAEIVTELARRYRTEEASMAAACLGFLGALQAADLVVEAGR